MFAYGVGGLGTYKERWGLAGLTQGTSLKVKQALPDLRGQA